MERSTRCQVTSVQTVTVMIQFTQKQLQLSRWRSGGAGGGAGTIVKLWWQGGFVPAAAAVVVVSSLWAVIPPLHFSSQHTTATPGPKNTIVSHLGSRVTGRWEVRRKCLGWVLVWDVTTSQLGECLQRCEVTAAAAGRCGAAASSRGSVSDLTAAETQHSWPPAAEVGTHTHYTHYTHYTQAHVCTLHTTQCTVTTTTHHTHQTH